MIKKIISDIENFFDDLAPRIIKKYNLFLIFGLLYVVVGTALYHYAYTTASVPITLAFIIFTVVTILIAFTLITYALSKSYAMHKDTEDE